MSPREVAKQCAEIVCEMYRNGGEPRDLVEVTRIRQALRAYADTLPSQSEAEQRDAVLEEAAKMFDGYTWSPYENPAKTIRRMKRQSATEGKDNG